MAKADAAVRAATRALRHDARLALRQPAHGGALRRSTRWARPPRTSRASAAVAREEQDAFALRSQERRRARAAAGRFAEEIVRSTLVAGRETSVVDRGRAPAARRRRLEKLARAQAAARTRQTVTAGNASGLNDGAGAVLLASEARGRALGLEPLARVLGDGGRRRRAAGDGPRAGARRSASCSRASGRRARRHRHRRAQRGVRGAGAPVHARARAPDDAEHVNPTAARSRSATRSARAARGWS